LFEVAFSGSCTREVTTFRKIVLKSYFNYLPVEPFELKEDQIIVGIPENEDVCKWNSVEKNLDDAVPFGWPS